MTKRRAGILIVFAGAAVLALLARQTGRERRPVPAVPTGTDAPPVGEAKLLPGIPTGDAESTPPDGPIIRGRIITTEGQPVRNASVAGDAADDPDDPDDGEAFLWSSMHTSGAGPRILWCATDDRGGYEIELPSLISGRKQLEVLVRAEGFAPGISKPIGIEPGARLYEVDLVLSPGATFTAIVTEEGTSLPVPGAALHVSPGSYQRDFTHLDGLRASNEPGLPTHRPPAALTDDLGRLTLGDLKPGDYMFLITREGFDCRHLGWVKVPFEEPIQVELHRLPPAEIRGVVVFPDGTPVHWAQVVAVNGDKGYWRGDFSKADGSFHIPGLPRGLHRLAVSRMGEVFFAPRTFDVLTGAGDVRLVVERGLTLRCRLVDIEGKPCAGIEINVHGEGYFTTDSEGRFSVGGLEEKTYRVDMVLWGRRQLHLMDASPGGEEITIVTPKR